MSGNTTEVFGSWRVATGLKFSSCSSSDGPFPSQLHNMCLLCIFLGMCTPRKTNMEPQNGGLEDLVKWAVFQVPC